MHDRTKLMQKLKQHLAGLLVAYPLFAADSQIFLAADIVPLHLLNAQLDCNPLFRPAQGNHLGFGQLGQQRLFERVNAYAGLAGGVEEFAYVAVLFPQKRMIDIEAYVGILLVEHNQHRRIAAEGLRAC
jgi:hypothetical protein